MWRLNVILIFTVAPIFILLFVIYRANQIANQILKEEEKTIHDMKKIINFIVPLLPDIGNSIKFTLEANRKLADTINEGERRLQEGIGVVDTFVERAQPTASDERNLRALDNTLQRFQSFVDA